MNKLASDLPGREVRPKRDLLHVEWLAILLATVLVCAAAFSLDAVI
jgi:hypothetical protein